MSTRIYTAWRVSLKRLNGFIDQFHDHCWEKALDRIFDIMGTIPDSELPPPDDAKDSEYIRMRDAFRRNRIALDLCTQAAKDSQRSGLDVEVGLNLWIRGRYAYCTPTGEESIYGDFKTPKYAYDFGYWNSSDKPDDVSGPEWTKRKNLWNKLTLGKGKADHNARRLHHDVVNLQDRGMQKQLLWSAMHDRLEGEQKSHHT